MISIFITSLVLPKRSFAQSWCGGCQVTCYDIFNPETGEQLCIDGCSGCTATTCSSGYYLAPDGTCHAIDTGTVDTGGGAYQYPTCSNLQCGTPSLWLTGGGQMTLNGDLAVCTYKITCGDTYFPSKFYGDEANCGINKGQCQTNCACCGAGEVYAANTVYGTPYVKEVNCATSNQFACGTLGDTFVSRTYGTGAGICYCDCPPDQPLCNINTCTRRGGTYVYNDKVTCQSITTTWSCTSVCNSTAASNVNVTQGSSGTTAIITWTPGTGGTLQRLYVDESQTEVNNGCQTPNACNVNAVLSSGSNGYIVTGLTPSTTYYFRVLTYESTSCTPSVTTSYTVPNLSLSGRVYLDTYNTCSTANPWSLGGLTVTVRGTAYSTSVASDGTFGFYGGSANPIDYLDLSGYSGAYVPSTAVGCNTGATLTTVSNPSSTNYYYLTPLREAWWQATGASVYATGSVRSQLPSPTTNLIESGAGGALGALMRSSGTLDTGSGVVSDLGYSAVTTYTGKKMNYDYFAAHLGVTSTTANDWAANTMNKPANNPDKIFYYLKPSAGSEASVTTPWTVSAGESYVVVVNGDLRIASDVVVENGGFLAFIVNGDLRVSPSVTNIQGIYDVDGVLTTESNGSLDSPADFAGSVVSWGGVSLGRDLVGSNAATPAESFVYRPDLLVNMPDSMKVFALQWQEVVPGSF